MPSPAEHTENVPVNKDAAKAINALVTESYKRVWEGINTGDATPHLAWIREQPIEVVRAAILSTQPRGWNTLAPPLVESLTDEQCTGVFAALVAVFVQAQPLQQKRG